MYRTSIPLGSLALSVLVAGGCSNGAGPSGLNQLNFNLASRPAAAAVNAAAGASFSVGTPETFTDGTNTLVINQVQLVLREIELHRAGAVADCAGGTSGDCEELELGPVLVDLPLGTGGRSSGTLASRSLPVPTTRSSSRSMRHPARTTPASCRPIPICRASACG